MRSVTYTVGNAILNWQAIPNAEQYKIYRSDVSGHFLTSPSMLVTTVTGLTTWTDVGAGGSNPQYYYRVISVNAGSSSSDSFGATPVTRTHSDSQHTK